jgi:hypothetical protein
LFDSEGAGLILTTLISGKYYVDASSRSQIIILKVLEDYLLERKVRTEGKRAVLCNINIMEKERGNLTYLLFRYRSQLCGRPYSKFNLIQIKCCAVETLLVVVYIVSSTVNLDPQTSRSAAVAEVCGIVCVLN